MNVCAIKHETVTKKVPYYVGIYASSDGHITDKNGTPLKVHDNEVGYLFVYVGVRFGWNEYVHRLVAKTFVHNPRPDIFSVVDHINGDTQDNRAENLRWFTHQLNALNKHSNARCAYFHMCQRIWYTKNGKRRYFKKYWADGKGRWQSKCVVNKKTHILGHYKTFLVAHHVAKAFRELRLKEIYQAHLNEAPRAPTNVPWLT